jgi:hypothetical protein
MWIIQSKISNSRVCYKDGVYFPSLESKNNLHQVRGFFATDFNNQTDDFLAATVFFVIMML